MHAARVLHLALFGIGLSSPALAVEINGAKVDARQTVSGTVLTLNGAGVRSKFFVSVYVGALYLQTPATTTEHVLKARFPKRVAMHIRYEEISAEKLRNAWLDGFEANTTDEQHAALASRIEQFNALFPAVKQGDELTVDCLAGGTRVSLNGTTLGDIAGADFCEPVLNIWLGDAPASRSLKQAMLGGG